MLGHACKERNFGTCFPSVSVHNASVLLSQVHIPQMINPADIKKEQDRGYSSFIPTPFLHSEDDTESTVSHSTDGIKIITKK